MTLKSTNTKKIRLIDWLIVGVAGLLVFNLAFLIYFYLIEKNEIQVQAPVFITQKNNLKIIFLDIGQGDAILIQTEDNKNILIDGGPDKGIIYKLDQYIPFYQRQIDLMILTHPDPDHLNGLVEVLKGYQVERVFYNGVEDSDLSYKEFLREIEEKKIKNEIVWFGKNFEFGNGKIEVLYPFENLSGKNFKNDNEASIVFKFIYGKIDILFTGDATQNVEKQLIAKGIDLSANVLKVAHHGSKNSSGLEFLEMVRPIYSVISVGQNKFGHPSLRVLKNLEKIKTKILRTDQLGDIIFETDGEDLKLKTKNEKRQGKI